MNNSIHQRCVINAATLICLWMVEFDEGLPKYIAPQQRARNVVHNEIYCSDWNNGALYTLNGRRQMQVYPKEIKFATRLPRKL